MKLYTENQMVEAFNAGGLNAIRDLRNRQNPDEEQRPVLSASQHLMEVYPELILSDMVIKILAGSDKSEDGTIEVLHTETT